MAPLCVRACACVCVFTLAEWRPRLSFAGADGYLECMRDQLQEVYAPFTPPCSPATVLSTKLATEKPGIF